MDITPVYVDESLRYNTCNAHWLSADTIVKSYVDIHRRDVVKVDIECGEANVHELVYAKTQIPTPRIRRVVDCGDGEVFIIMDRIRGRQLSEVWDSSIWKKLWVAFTLRRYITQLRHLTKAPPGTPPGPISPRRSKHCDSPRIFGELYPRVFPTVSDLAEFCNRRYLKMLGWLKTPQDDPAWKETFDSSEPLVNCHGDLVPRNMILGDDGWLWLVDWRFSGYYPPWFENYGMTIAAREEWMSLGNSYKYWNLFLPFICGGYFRQTAWLDVAAFTFDYAASP
ncbi:hypothetical protein D9756_000918 [Leucocoprinus leucothites]|uniref:Aminoglycoside phosphotransferase domain-containing protein n=1 Tax=Leucocoprinus leucothites TaxID=201217 RepID=A0A8H5GF35_9AGAR|nr:hypothetical protein D9756_000918 [Leucoagaricus leucothites]